jgi:arsenate reductase (thioredoxin)
MVRILFICSGNSCRSQMAEGWARTLKAGVIEPYSAGLEPHGLHPDAVRAMAEVGIDISNQRSKPASLFHDWNFDIVVTLSDRARKLCPILWKSSQIMHIAIESPPQLAASASTDEERLAFYRHARNEIRALVDSLPESLQSRLMAGDSQSSRQRLHAMAQA